MSNNDLWQQLSKCREFMLKKGFVRNDFGNPNFQNDNYYINLTGISNDRLNTLYTLVEKKTQEKENIPLKLR